MGNTIGVECSFGHVHVTSILINEKIRKKKNAYSLIGNTCSDVSKNNYSDNNNGGLNNICSNNYASPYEKRKEKDEFNTHGKSNNDYLKMQKDMFVYMLNIKHIIEGDVQMAVLKNNADICEHAQFSLAHLTNFFKGEEKKDLLDCFPIFNNFVKSEVGINIQTDEAIKVDIYGKSTIHMDNHGDAINTLKGEDEIARIYFFTVQVKHIEEALFKCTKDIIKNVAVNLTGGQNYYIEIKLRKLIELKSMHYHKEIKCIQSAINFLKKFYPGCLYHFLMSKENNEAVKNGGDSINDRNKLREHLLNKEEAGNICPYLIVNVKRGISYHLVNEKNIIQRIGSCFISYKTIQNLFFLITGKFCSLQRICKLAINGINRTFDMTVGDIYGTSYGNAGLSSDLTASFFGNAQHISNIKSLFNCYDADVDEDEKENEDHVEEGTNSKGDSKALINTHEDVANSTFETSTCAYFSDSSISTLTGSDNSSTHFFTSKTHNNLAFKYMKRNNNSGRPFFLNFYSHSSYTYESCITEQVKPILQKEGEKEEANTFLRNSISDTELSLNTQEKIKCIKRGVNKNITMNSYEDKRGLYPLLNKKFNGLKINPLTNMRKFEQNSEQIRKKNFNKVINCCSGKNTFEKIKCVNENKSEQSSANNEYGEINNFFLENKNEGAENRLFINNNIGNKTHCRKKKRTVKFNKKECDLMKSLLSMVIFNSAQQSYIHSYLYNVKHIVFSGILLDNEACLQLMKIYITFMYHNEQKLYFTKVSPYVSSLGAALQMLSCFI
ncbi:hypothetical protein, conserved [Plasmodium malariae]|uniref:Pantothenate kinase n=1 Tax=Plasmodium malariae TaxID=5858 RepID=A0A1A8WV30_PLAMA|nr:hypothetical protein, conserved [Plasmodium malariae]